MLFSTPRGAINLFEVDFGFLGKGISKSLSA